MKILNILASNKYSGAENVVCQIANLINDKNDVFYCSPTGMIENSLKDKKITYFGISKFNMSNIKKIIKITKPDIIFAHDIKASFLTSLVHGKISYVCFMHNNARGNGKFSLRSVLFAMACKKAKKVVFVSDSCFDSFYFRKLIKKKSVVIKNIVSIDELEKKVEKDNNSYNFDAIYLGRLVWQKNLPLLLEILNLAISIDNKLKIAIVGDGELRTNCENYIKENKLSNNIKMFGFLSNPYKILKDSKVMIMSSFCEGLPMSALEAISLGVPILSTKTDGLVDIVKNGETGYFYKTKEEAVDCLFKILKNPLKYKKECLSYSKKINNLKNYKKQIEKILEK
jgi:glycosyltransferase involved in cell wall biosynthesis